MAVLSEQLDEVEIHGFAGVEEKEVMSVGLAHQEASKAEELAVDVTQEYFSEADKVILVNEEKFPDAISACGDYLSGKLPDPLSLSMDFLCR